MDIETQKIYRYRKYFIFCLQTMQIIFLAMQTIQAPLFLFLLMLIKKLILFSRRHYVIDFVRPKIILPRKHVLQEHPDSKVLYDYTDDKEKKNPSRTRQKRYNVDFRKETNAFVLNSCYILFTFNLLNVPVCMTVLRRPGTRILHESGCTISESVSR